MLTIGGRILDRHDGLCVNLNYILTLPTQGGAALRKLGPARFENREQVLDDPMEVRGP